jgi:hypothetical protein
MVMASVPSATDGAAPKRPAKLRGLKMSPNAAKPETASPPMKKRRIYSSMTADNLF